MELRVGNRVRRIQAWDRSGMEGRATGPELTVMQVFPGQDFSICKLSDGRHEFEFNLVKQDNFSFAEAAQCAAS
jgi:hypothetical protein